MTARPLPRLNLQISGLMGARLIGAAAGFLTQILLARLLGPSDLGTFYLVTSATLLLGSVAALGYGGIAARLVVRYRARQDGPGLEGFVASAWRDAIGTALLCAALMLPLALAAGWPIGAAAVGAAAVPAFALLRVNGGLANAFGWFQLSFLPDNLLRPVLFAAVLGGLALVEFQIGPLTVLGLFTVLSLMLAGAQALALVALLHRAGSGFHRAGGLRARPDARRARCWRRSGRALMVPLLVAGLSADIAILLADVTLDDGELGLFGAAVKLAFLFGFAVQIAHQLAAPALAARLACADRAGLVSLIDRVNALAIAAAGLGLAAVALFGGAFLALFGEGFQDGHAALVILAGAQLARAAAGPSLPLLAAAGKHGATTAPHLLYPLLTGMGMLVLGPVLGLAGAATAVLLGTVCTSAWLCRIVHRELGVRCAGVGFARPPIRVEAASPSGAQP